MDEKKTVCLAHGIAFIDPADCGSTVGYRFTEDHYSGVHGTIVITECTRTITWNIYCEDESGITKLDNAIAMLMKARLACLEGIERQKVVKVEREKAKAEEEKAKAEKVEERRAAKLLRESPKV